MCDKVITTTVIKPLDDPTYFVRLTVIRFGGNSGKAVAHSKNVYALSTLFGLTYGLSLTLLELFRWLRRVTIAHPLSYLSNSDTMTITTPDAIALRRAEKDQLIRLKIKLKNSLQSRNVKRCSCRIGRSIATLKLVVHLGY